MFTRICPGSSYHRGFTLIEVLAAMVLLSIVLAAATASLAQFSDYSERIGERGQDVVSSYLKLARLKEVVEGTKSFYLKDPSDKVIPFFEGDATSVRFVTGRSMESQDGLFLVELSVGEDTNDSSLVELRYSVTPLLSTPLISYSELNEIEIAKESRVIAAASEIEIEYLGIDDLRTFLLNSGEENYLRKLNWQSQFNAKDNGFMPAKMKIVATLPDGRTWPCIFVFRIQNPAKRTLMLDGAL